MCTSRVRNKDYEGLTVGESIFLSNLISSNMLDYSLIQKGNCLMTEPGLSSLPPDRQLPSVWQVTAWALTLTSAPHSPACRAYADTERSWAFSKLLYCPLQGAKNGSLACNPKIGSPVCKPDRDLLFPVHLLWKDDLIFLLERIRAFL